MLTSSYKLPALPPPVDLKTIRILKALNRVSWALADLKGQARTIPNQGILIDTLALQEAKASSEIETAWMIGAGSYVAEDDQRLL